MIIVWNLMISLLLLEQVLIAVMLFRFFASCLLLLFGFACEVGHVLSFSPTSSFSGRTRPQVQAGDPWSVSALATSFSQ